MKANNITGKMVENFLKGLVLDYNDYFQSNPDVPNFLIKFLNNTMRDMQESIMTGYDAIKDEKTLSIEDRKINHFLMIEYFNNAFNAIRTFLVFLNDNGKTLINLEEIINFHRKGFKKNYKGFE